MKDFYKNLFEYNNWANIRMIDSLKELEGKDIKSFKLASHLVDAQINWLHRIMDSSSASQQFWNQYGHKGPDRAFNKKHRILAQIY
jgi:uncharacterized damage-inducible protein DinB